WGSQTWQGIGNLGAIGDLEEGIDLSPIAVTLRLNALDATILGIALTEPVFNRRLLIYRGLLNDNGQLVDTPEVRWCGYMDVTAIEYGGDQDGVELRAESDLRFFDQANGTRFTDEDQQKRYPGDTFFQYLARIIDARLVWGPEGQRVNLGGAPVY